MSVVPRPDQSTTPSSARTPGFRHLSGLPIVQVVFNEGAPVAVEMDGRCWQVAADPATWFERAKWWENSWSPREAPAVEVQVWRLQVRLGGARSQLRTLDVAHDRTGAWKLLTVDGEPVRPARSA